MASKQKLDSRIKKEKSNQYRDFSLGRISPYAANVSTIPINSVSNSFNVNFDTVLGAGKVRLGTTALGAVVATGKTPLGLAEFVGAGGSPNLLLSVFKGASTATIRYYDTAWHDSTTTNLSNTSKCRFATLGGRSFMVNGNAAMISSADGATWATTNCITTDSVVPSLIYRYKQRMLAGGFSTYPDRVYFSSIIAPQSSPSLTWATDATTGNWIDVNPDEGDNITGFSDVSNVFLVFKKKGFYRMDIINKTVDTEPVYDAGAVSQEAIVKCQGMVYFFSGDAIYSTNGGYPTQISRLGIQDFIDAIPQANWSQVSMGADTFNIYLSTGQITVNGFTNYYVLKYSVRDQSWSIHYYPTQQYFYAKFTDTNGRLLRFTDSAGYVQTLNLGNTDNGTSRFYSLETQELDFGDRSSTDKVTDKMVIYGRDMMGSKMEYKIEKGDYQPINIQLLDNVNAFDDLNIDGRYFKFKWSGQTSGASPVFEGLYFPTIINQGTL